MESEMGPGAGNSIADSARLGVGVGLRFGADDGVGDSVGAGIGLGARDAVGLGTV